MADRMVRIVIAADVAQAIRGMQQVQQGLGQVGQAGEQAGASTASFGDKIKQALEVAGVTLGLAGLAGAIGKTIAIGRAYEDNMNELAAVTQASGDQMSAASARARELGSDLDLPATSASDAAEAMLTLAKGGLTVTESMAAAKGTLLLAAAAQISGAEAAEIQSDALNAFGLAASDADRVANVLANTANASSGSIQDFGAGMSQAATVANGFGVSIEDTSTMLGLFANAGIKGSDAGTSFKTMLTSLNAPTAAQQKGLDALGISTRDAAGQFVGMESITNQLSDAHGRLSSAEFDSAAQAAFGADAIRGALVAAEAGAAGWDGMSEAVTRAGGVQEMAAAKTQGLSGAIGAFQSKLEDVALNLYGNFSPALEDAVGFATGAVDVIGDLAGWFSELPGPVQAASIALGVVVAMSGPLNALWAGMGAKLAAAGAAWGAFSARVAAASGVMATAGVVGRSLMAALGGPLGIALAVGATALAVFAGSSGDAAAETEGLTEAIDGQTGALTSNAAQLLADKAATSGAGQAYKNLGGDVADYVDAMGGVPGAQEKVNAVIEAGRAAYKAQQDAVQAATVGTGNFGTTAAATTGQMAGLAPSIHDVNKAAEFLASTDATLAGRQAEVALTGEGMKGALGGAGDAAAGAAPDVEALGDALKKATENAQLMASLTEGAQQLSAVSAAASDASRALDLFKIAQDNADGRVRSLDEATANQAATLRSLESALKDGTAAATENKEAGDLNTEALFNWDVAALTATESGGKVFDEMTRMADQYAETTEAAYSNTAATGDLAKANDDARYAASLSRGQFVALMSQYNGGNVPAAEALADKLGILDGTKIDNKVFDTINQDAEAQRKLREAQAAEIANKTFQVIATDNATPFLQRVQSYTINDKTFRITQINETQYRTATGQIAMADGGIVHAAAGRVVAGRGRSTVMDGSGAGLTWAEAATNKEYYLSMKAGMESRNRALTAAAARDLGGQAFFGRAGDVRAGSFSPPTGSMSGSGGGQSSVVITLRGDGPITEAALQSAQVVVGGALRDLSITVGRAGGQSR